MGHNFRPDYLKLTRFAKECGAKTLLALTATATTPVLDDICRGFEIAEADAVRTAFYRPNLTLLTTAASPRERLPVLKERLAQHPAGATIVYVTKQRDADEAAESCTQPATRRAPTTRVRRARFAARSKTGSSSRRRRSSSPPSPSAWESTKPTFGTSTTWHCPRAWRTTLRRSDAPARDGRASICEVFASRDDLNALENFVYGDTPSRLATQRALEEIFSERATPETWIELSLYHLAQSSDVRQLVLSTLLTYLELDGMLSAGTPTYSTFELAPSPLFA